MRCIHSVEDIPPRPSEAITLPPFVVLEGKYLQVAQTKGCNQVCRISSGLLRLVPAKSRPQGSNAVKPPNDDNEDIEE
jgi:hypothetical protein